MANVILTARVGEPLIDDLNRALEQIRIDRGLFTQVDHLAAGPKCMEAAVYIGGFNHLDEPVFLHTLRAFPWVDPASVQLFVKRQEDERFTEIDLFDRFEPPRRQKMAVGKGLHLHGPADQQRFFESLAHRLAEYRESLTPYLQNPLRTMPWRQRIAETTATEPWVFEVLTIHPPRYYSSSVGSHHDLMVDLAYQGAAAILRCDRADIGGREFDRLHAALVTADPGDTLGYTGLIYLMDDRLWSLELPQTIEIEKI